MGTDKRLEAGWFQRIAWSVLVWGSLGLLMWVPFLYVAIRRGRGSDWGAFASFALYEAITLSWAGDGADGAGDPILGAVVIVTLLMATAMLLFALFDRRPPKPVYGAAVPMPPPHGYPYVR